MSAEYAARMEILQRKREELTAQRQAVEKRMALREATAAEFSAVALQSYKQKWKTQRNATISAKTRNDEFVRSLYETQRQVHDTWSRLQSDQSSSSARLAQEKARYNRRVEQIYPAWQEQLQRQRVMKLKELEDKKRAVERRRYLAKKSFEKEQTLSDLIRRTRHEVEMAENLEQNELYERDLLRTQNTNQAKEVDQSIREVAQEARSYLQKQATKHFEVTPELGEEVAEKLSETFSPRHTLRAMQEAGSSLAFEDNWHYEEQKPVRQIRVEIPARMNSPYRDDFAEESPQEQYETPAFFSSTMTERYEGNADNGYTDFKPNITKDQPAKAPRFQSSRNSAATPGPRSTSYPVMERQPAAPYNVRGEETINKSRDHLEGLLTLATGRLYSIPETNEQISSGGTSSVVPAQVDARGSEPNKIPKHESANTSANSSSSMPFTLFASSRTSPPELPSAKKEENGAASSPTTVSPILATATAPAEETLHPPLEHQGSAVTPDPFIKETRMAKPPALSIPESIEPDTPTINRRNPATSAEAPLQESSDEHRKAEDSAIPPVEQSVMDEGNDFSLSAQSVSGPSQTNATDDFSSTSIAPVETKEISRETTAEESIMDIPAAPRTSFKNDHTHTSMLDQTLSHDSGNSLQIADSALEPIDENVPIVDTFIPHPVETHVENVQEYGNENTTTEVPEPPPPSNSYRMDLLEPLSPPSLLPTDDDMMLTSVQSDDFDLSSGVKPVTEVKPTISDDTTVVVSSEVHHTSPRESRSPVAEEVSTVSVTEKLSPVDQVKALGALISRVEEGATEGDILGGPSDTGSSNESKRELVKMAVGGRKAQIAFFGSDICFELVLNISRDLGPVLFPPKAFEGIMNDQKIRKLHQSNKEKQLDLWKALSAHLKQLVELKAIGSATLVDLFVAAFLAHDPDNQRSQRKLREFLVTVCGGAKAQSPRKETPSTSQQKSPPRQTPSPEPAKASELIGTPQLLQTAFLQRQSPPKPKVFGIASSSFKDRSSGSSDVLMSMGSGPMKLSQKLMRGGKMNDYSEFEEEEEVDLQNLIGAKSTFTSGSSALGRSRQVGKTAAAGKTAGKDAAAEEDDEFDADF